MNLSVETERKIQDLRRKLQALERERAQELARRDAAWKVVKALSPFASAFDPNLQKARDEAENAQRAANAKEREAGKLRGRLSRLLNPGFKFQEEEG